MSRHGTKRLLAPETLLQAQALLEQFLHDSQATLALLVDRNGRVLAAQSHEGTERLASLGASVAAVYAALQSVASLLHEERFLTLLHEGLRERLLAEAVGSRWLLVVIFGQHVPLGLMRVLGHQLAEQLTVLLEPSTPPRRLRERRIRRAAQDTVDLIFGFDATDTEAQPGANPWP
ncbi:MAG: roadblock/LC7 domain-containing protein [Thermorudis peleae]|nr:roadblock/LC7 domain-containing protein [Thermorudis peleae]